LQTAFKWRATWCGRHSACMQAVGSALFKTSLFWNHAKSTGASACGIACGGRWSVWSVVAGSGKAAGWLYGQNSGALLLCSWANHLARFLGRSVCIWGADCVVVFFLTLSLRLTRRPWWWGLDRVAWLCEACNNALICLAIFNPRSLHQRGACKLCLSHTHATCQRVIVPLFSKRQTQCEWQHCVRDTAGTFGKDYTYSIWFMRGT